MLPHTHAHTHIYKQVFSAGSVVRSGSRTMQKCAHLHTSAYNLPALVVLGYWLKVKSGVSGGVVVKDMGHVWQLFQGFWSTRTGGRSEKMEEQGDGGGLDRQKRDKRQESAAEILFDAKCIQTPGVNVGINVQCLECHIRAPYLHIVSWYEGSGFIIFTLTFTNISIRPQSLL